MNDNESETNINLSVDETDSDNEVCEICPIYQEPAYGKIVQLMYPMNVLI